MLWPFNQFNSKITVLVKVGQPTGYFCFPTSLFQACVCVTPGSFMRSVSGQIPDCSTLWRVPLECRLKSQGVQPVPEARVRMRICFSCPQSLLLQSMSSHWLQGRINPLMLKWVCVNPIQCLPGRQDIFQSQGLSWEGYGGGHEESPDWMFTVIPQRRSDGNPVSCMSNVYFVLGSSQSRSPLRITWHQREAVALMDYMWEAVIKIFFS